ncbi:MAG: Crp/Fnr family transcriptional regulator [Bacteroidota bacterium]
MNYIEIIKREIDKANLWQKSISLSRGEYLKVEGSTDTNLYYIENGSLRIFRENDFEEQTIRLGYKNNFIAALDSYISEKPSELYIQAIKKSELKVVPKPAFQKWLESDPTHIELWLKITTQLIYEQLEREKDILTNSPYERYQRVLKRSPHLFQEVPNKYIASYLRMTPETLSRIKKS